MLQGSRSVKLMVAGEKVEGYAAGGVLFGCLTNSNEQVAQVCDDEVCSVLSPSSYLLNK